MPPKAIIHDDAVSSPQLRTQASTSSPAHTISLENKQELSEEEYNTLRDSFVNLVNTQDPQKALSDLQEKMNTSDAVLRSCHGLVHEIGRAAYKRYANFTLALTYEDEVCGSGYLHGVIEAHFSEVPDIFSEMQTLCKGSGKCYHGVGHGIMYYTANDLPQSIHMCDSYTTTSAKIFCSEGVFMENFTSDQALHPSNFRKPNDPFYPCLQQTTLYKGSCYFYAARYYLLLHPNQYKETLAWCKTAEPSHIASCSKGVGSITMKHNIRNPKFVETICESSDSTQVAICIDGMVGYYLVNFNSLQKGRDMCQQLEERNRQTCLNAIVSRKNMFTD